MTGRDAGEPDDVADPAAEDATGDVVTAGDDETTGDDAKADPDAAAGDGPLAAIVRKERGDEAIAAVRDAGVYDDARRIVEHDDGTIAVPVTEPPAFEVLDVVRQRDPDRRASGLEDLLRERGWTDEELAGAPASWAVVGTVLLVDLPADCPDERAVGEALLELHREADTVLAREGVEGQMRDPQRRVVAGTGETETIHAEHGVRYALDLAEELFSPGNKAERARIGALVAAGSAAEPALALDEDGIPDRLTDLDAAPVDDADGTREPEHVFDMFAGVGYFALPAAVAGARVTAAEIDADTFGYLVENAQLNGVGDRVAAYLADCSEVAPAVEADRVVMGHYDAGEYLDAAFEAVRDGGVLHYHAVAHESELPDRPRERIEAAAAESGRPVDVAAVRRVKSYGEGVWHVVADARVSGGRRG